MEKDSKNPLKINTVKPSNIKEQSETPAPDAPSSETPAPDAPSSETPAPDAFDAFKSELLRRSATSNKASTSFEDLLRQRRGGHSSPSMLDELARRKTLFKK